MSLSHHVDLCRRVQTRLEALPRDMDHEPERQLLEDCLCGLRDRLTVGEDVQWRALCRADADRPGRYVPRPSTEVRHGACLGFGCRGCAGGVITKGEQS